MSDEPPHHAGAGTGLQRISVIIPARNERDSLPAVLKELPRDRLGEIIVIDGHSTDGTPELVRDLGFTAITQDGRGYGMGVISGIRAASGDLLTFFDADGSYDPEALPRMMEALDQGYDFIFCSRYWSESGSDDDTWVRLLGNKIFTFLLRTLFGVRLTDSLFFYALGSKQAFEALDLKCTDFSLCIEVPVKVHKMGYRYTEIPSRERPRIAGKSKVNAVLDGIRILSAMIGLKFRGY